MAYALCSAVAGILVALLVVRISEVKRIEPWTVRPVAAENAALIRPILDAEYPPWGERVVLTVLEDPELGEVPLVAWRVDLPGSGGDDGAPDLNLLITAGIHGDEPAATLAAYRLANRIRGTVRPGGKSLRIHILPAVNPVGLVRGTRQNLDGVDLNRDFAARDSVESAALWDYVLSEGPFDFALDLHESSRGTYFAYRYYGGEDGLTGAYRSEIARLGLPAENTMAEWGSVAKDGVVSQRPWLMLLRRAVDRLHFDGALLLSAIVPDRRGNPPVFTLETPKRDPIGTRVRAHESSALAMIRAFLADSEFVDEHRALP